MRRSQVGFRAHLAAVAILAAIPFVAGGAAISYLYVSGEREQTQRRLISSASDMLASIERELAGALIALRTLVLSEPLARGDFQAFQRQAEEAARLFPESAIVLRRPDGQQVVNTVRPWGTSLPVSQDSAILAAGAKRTSLFALQMSAYDPQRSSANISCCNSEARLSPYQSARLSRYDAPS